MQKLYIDYLKAEHVQRPIIALALPPSGGQGAPLLIRRGPALSCLQPAEPVAALSQSACAPGHHASSQVTVCIRSSSGIFSPLAAAFPEEEALLSVCRDTW